MSTTLGVSMGSESHGESPLPQRSTSLRKELKAALFVVLKPAASLQVTVALFALSMLLVFFGTMAQIEKSNISVVNGYFRCWHVWIPLQLIAEFGKKFFDFPETLVWKRSFPFPGGWVLGGLMLINLLAAHLTRFKLTWRRAGVITIHLGVIILLVGELVTGLCAVESRMMLQVGESKNFIDHSRDIELAFTNEATQQTTTIPQDKLNPGETISNPNLPVDVEVVARYKNTTLRAAVGGDDSDKLISIFGGRNSIEPANESSGVSMDQSEDVPGVRVRLLNKQTREVMGERLYSLREYENGPENRKYMALPSKVSVDGSSFTVELRNERIYKPYTITLLNFEQKKHPGTNTAKDFASTVRLQDPETGEDREVRIWMNHPLRHGGETFYQLSFLINFNASGDVKDTGTVLQVVKNPGWLLPYVSCIVVTLGMLIHFGLSLVRFREKMSAKPAPATPTVTTGNVHGQTGTNDKQAILKKYLPWAIIGVCAVYSVSMLFPKLEKTADGFDLSAFGAIPVLDDGRVKPFDSLARTKMLFISGQSEFQDHAGTTHPAILWLLETLATDDPHLGRATDYPVFRIDNEQVLQLLELKYKPGFYRYSLNELRPRLNKFFVALKTAEDLNENKRELYHAKIIELAERLKAYEQLARHAAPTLIPKDKGSDTWLTLAEIDQKVAQQNPQLFEEARKEASEEVRQEMSSMSEKIAQMSQEQQADLQRAILVDIEKRTEAKLPQLAARMRGTVSPAAAAFTQILSEYRANRPNAFAKAINTYTSDYTYPLNREFTDTVKFEQQMNRANPLIVAAFLFVFAAVCRSIGWVVWEKPLSQIAWGLALISFGLLLVTLFGRMYIMQRPLVFVTNLYSSALMIGAGTLTAGLVIERIYRNGIGLIIGVAAAASAVDIAHHLSTDGKDTLGALVAVLDTNYWLASHVTTITLGYSATYVAGLLGLSYIVWGLFSTTLTKEKHAALSSMIYGVLCFATLLSFVGTVLGGIWADQSWGRFWGWDPKENGAVLIVMWNTLILHARWCGLVKQRGIAVLSIVGIMVTTWSWFGTNQLGAGLHNYGFNKSLADGCTYTWLTCMAVIGMGLIPLKYWRSFAGTGLPRPDLATVVAGLGHGVPANQESPNANRQQAKPPRGKITGKGR